MSFNYAAEILLFRQIFLKRNIESFARLNLVAEHPRFRKFVRELHYSGVMLSGPEPFRDFAQWSQAFEDEDDDHERAYTGAIRFFPENLTSEQLQRRFVT